MAEEERPEHGHGHGSGTMTLPGVGPVKKKVVYVVGGTAAAYVLWRYWQARAASAGADAAAQDPGMADSGTLPSVAGAVKPDNGYGMSDGGATGTEAYGFHGTTNAQWTQYAANQLSAASDKWSAGDVLAALGAYLNNRPLTTTQTEIVQAAIGAAGYPPEGTHPIIPGGNVGITVAPKNVRAWNTTTATSAGIQWDPVPGASHYRIYRADTGGEPIGDSVDTKYQAPGLQPSVTYRFQVAAVTASGQTGPKSSTYTVKTKAIVLGKPGSVKVSAVSKTTARISWSRVPGADYYRIYLGNDQRGSTDGGNTSYTVTGLAPNHTYKVSVAADTTHQTPGPRSGAVTFRTKK